MALHWHKEGLQQTLRKPFLGMPVLVIAYAAWEITDLKNTRG